jgi:L-ascorbate metabolism protein UlaG (beta-lactamase superfamily)
MTSKDTSYTNNPDLSTLSLPFEWKGTPVDSKGRFINHEFPFVNSFKELFKWQTMKNPQKEEKKNETWHLNVLHNNDFIHSTKDCIVWLGHASFFIRLAGITILIDPILYDVSLLKRKSPLPVDPDQFRNIDYILISHDHRDHCDKKSLKLLSQNNPDAVYLTGLKNETVIHKITHSKQIQAAGWYQQYNTNSAIKIYYVPTRHWGRRYLTDTNIRLWGGYIIQGVDKTIYFGGDSGYGSHFKDIAQIFPCIDYAMIGIGAYKPEFFMGQSHLSPIDAIQAFKDTKAKKMIPMHYGTFDLADEPLGDPIHVLEKELTKTDLKNDLVHLSIGEMIVL